MVNMARICCKACGGELNITGNSSIVVCEYCGLTQTVPKGNDDTKLALYEKANALRRENEFDLAQDIYMDIISDYPEEAEAYWGAVLCRYGIEYVDDISGKKIPTCHRVSSESVLEDSDFKDACENADVILRREYLEEAKALDELRNNILSISKKEDPYDVFICYKETNDIKQRTQDSVEAMRVYDALTRKGYKVFFSRISLENHAGEAYEPYIFSALNSARLMLVFGSRPEYINSVWVKNEWSRYLALKRADNKRQMVVCYLDMEEGQIPGQLQNLPKQNMGLNGAVQDLVRGIESIVPLGENERVLHVTRLNRNALKEMVQEAFGNISNKEWNKATPVLNKVLDMDPENGDAYLGLALIAKKIPTKEEYTYEYAQGKFSKNEFNIQQAEKYADSKLKSWFDNMENARKKVIRQNFTASEDIIKRVRKDVVAWEKNPTGKAGSSIAELHKQFNEYTNKAAFDAKEAGLEFKLPLIISVYFVVATVICLLLFNASDSIATMFLVLCVIAAWYFIKQIKAKNDTYGYICSDHPLIMFIVNYLVLMPLGFVFPVFVPASLSQSGEFFPAVLWPVLFAAISYLFYMKNRKRAQKGYENFFADGAKLIEINDELNKSIKAAAFKAVSNIYQKNFPGEDPEFMDIDRESFSEERVGELYPLIIDDKSVSLYKEVIDALSSMPK